MPTVTEGAPDHDVVWVAEGDIFGDYFPYRTYRPESVGTQGLRHWRGHKSLSEYAS